MLKAKRFLSIVLASIMVFSCFAFASSAAMDSGKVAGLILESDKTDIQQGDTVTITMRAELVDGINWTTMRCALLYDPTVFTPDVDSASMLNDFAGLYDCDKKPAVNANFWKAAVADSTLTDAEKAIYTAALYQQFTVMSSKNGGITEKMGTEITKEDGQDYSVPEYEVTFTVTGDPTKGSTKIFICDGYTSKSQTLKTTDGAKVTSQPLSAIDISRAQVTLNAGGEVAAPVLTKAASQVKMTATSATTVEDAFQFRVISKISDADWNTYFANTGKDGATANAITSVGFVAYKGTAGFDLDTAKAAVTGTAAAGYEVATTDYIQHTDGSDAQFGCRIDITSAETRSDVTYVAFAQYVDADGAAQVVFYDASYEALLATNYTGIVAAYLAAFPYAG